MSLSSSPIKTDWKGQWIWCKDPKRQQNAYALFRRDFKTTDSGELHLDITADTFYNLYIDGAFIHRGPARGHLEYYGFDRMTLRLPAGPHTLAVLVHQIGRECATHRLGRAGLRVDASVVGQDFATDSRWKGLWCGAYQELPEMLSHFGWQEDVDTALLPLDWQTMDFDDKNWPGAVCLTDHEAATWDALCLRDIPLCSYHTVMPTALSAGSFIENTQPDFHQTAASRVRSSEGPFALSGGLAANRFLLADFGCTLSGTVEIEIADAVAGQELILSYDDQLNTAGFVNPARTYARYADRFILRGGSQKITTALPRGFRYVMADFADSAQPCKVISLTALCEEIPYTPDTAFAYSDERLNALYAQCLRTTRICTLDGFTDCVTRERVLWMQDLYIDSLNVAYAGADFGIVRRMLFMFAQGQQFDGRIITYTPSDLTWCSNPPGNFQWLQLLVEYLRFSGDTDSVLRLLPTAQGLLRYFTSHEGKDGLVDSWAGDDQFWDWGVYEQRGRVLMTNAYYAMILTLLSRYEIFDSIAGKAAAEKAERIRSLCRERFWNEESECYFDAILPDGTKSPIVSQQANMMAIWSGICPPERVKKLMRKILDPANLGETPVGEIQMTDQIRAEYKKIVPPGTLVGAATACLAAFSQRMGHTGLELIRKHWLPYADMPTLPEMILNGSNNTVCHGWSASPAYLLPMFVLGLRPTGAGWETATFAPQPMSLEKASGSVWTPHGRLTVRWNRQGFGIRLFAHVPAGITLTIAYGDYTKQVNGEEFEITIAD